MENRINEFLGILMWKVMIVMTKTNEFNNYESRSSNERYELAKELVDLKPYGPNSNKIDNKDFANKLVTFIDSCDLNTKKNIDELVNSATNGLYINNEIFKIISWEPPLGVLRLENDGLASSDGQRRYYTDVKVNCDGKDYYVTRQFGDDKTNDTRWIVARWAFEKAGIYSEQIEELEKIFNNRKKELEERKNNEGKKIENQLNERKNGENEPIKGRNIIIYGAPGTGKSHYVERRYGRENITRIVFHNEYTYFDFVGQYRPSPLYKKNNEFVSSRECGEERYEPFIDYKFVPGPFTNVLVKAWNNKDKMYTLLIEELNRADAAAVFGDVFQLLDRKKNGESEYDIEPSTEWGEYLKNKVQVYEGKVKIPANMNIIATMNSADQGVYMLDTAFKRRWDYEFRPIKLEEFSNKNAAIKYKEKTIKWVDFIKAINNELGKGQIPEDRRIGQFFVPPDKFSKNPNDNINAVKKVLFYLWDDVLRNNDRQIIFRNDIDSMTRLFELYNDGNGKDKDIFSSTLEDEILKKSSDNGE